MKKIILKRILHREQWRYAMYFDFDPELEKIVRGIPDSRYSSTHKCWYTGAAEDNLRNILQAFRERAEVDISGISYRSDPGKEKLSPPVEAQTVTREVLADETGQEPLPGHLKSSGRARFDPVEFRIAEKSGRLVVRFTGRYDQSWIDEIKSYGKTYYDRVHREFLLRWSKLTVDSLSDYFTAKGIPVRVVKPSVDPETREQRKSFGEIVRTRGLSDEGNAAVQLLRQHLEDSRYSVRTIETYLTLLELFFKYFHTKHPDEITQNEVSGFMNEFIIRNGFSASYQNQMISAIKLYYELSGKGRIIPQFLERPRRGRALPKVFSKEEVTRILNSARNPKHKLLLWMIYSCGLRRSEVTNIRLNDIDRGRNIIHIVEGKGGVDRIVPVSEKLWPRIDEYIDSYQPSDYLFEGKYGRRYSVESVYNVFRQALKRAGINRDVGVHSLRHSFATHLHESGLDIRFIQELLGHKSTRTTEIYTHVSRRNLVSVKSPLDDLDVK